MYILYVYIYIYTHTYIHMFSLMPTYVYLYMFIHIYINIYIYICMYTCMYICMYLYTCIYSLMCIIHTYMCVSKYVRRGRAEVTPCLQVYARIAVWEQLRHLVYPDWLHPSRGLLTVTAWQCFTVCCHRVTDCCSEMPCVHVFPCF